MPIHRLAIVDRDAAALRIMQAARECPSPDGCPLVTIAFFDDADREASFVRAADEAVGLGGDTRVVGAPTRGGLDLAALEEALLESRADAAWAGWGSAADGAALAELCASLGITWIGSPPEVLRRLRDPAERPVLAAAAGLGVAAVGGGGREVRRLAVPVLADRHGTVWAWDPSTAAAVHRGATVIAEAPPPAVRPDDGAALRAAARRIAGAAGLVGAGTVTLLWTATDGAPVFEALHAGLDPRHALAEGATGCDLATLTLRVIRGERLPDAPPPGRGHGFALWIHVLAPSAGSVPAPATVARLRLAGGPGVRVDAVAAEGDAWSADEDAVIAALTVRGTDRAAALARVGRALAESSVVVGNRATTLPMLRLAARRAELRTGEAPAGWLDALDLPAELQAQGDAAIAILVAAAESYDRDAALGLARFLAGAARGRPVVPDEIGAATTLVHRGRRYPLHVRCVAPGQYRIDAGAGPTTITVERLGALERRVRAHGLRARALVVASGSGWEVEIEGVPYRIDRDAGGIVTAPVPAVVLAIPVAPGARVAAGERVAILETMKMEVPVHAPFAGRVREVRVMPNVQVSVGAPLVVLEPDDAERVEEPGPVVRLAPPPAPADAAPRADAGDALRWLVLGFDVTAGEVAAPASPRDRDAPAEHRVLAAFADVHALFRRLRASDDLEEIRSAQEHFLRYLRALDGAGAGLPPTFRRRLERALAHYGVSSLEHTPALEAALLRMWIARARAEEQLAPVVAILERRLAAGGPEDASDPELRPLLDRLVATCEGRFPVVADRARALRHRDFDAPLLAAAREAVYARATAALAELPRATPAARAALVAELVECPQPLMARLASRFAAADPASREAMLEVITRRYYRIRQLTDVRVERAGGDPRVETDYDLDGTSIHVVTAFAPDRELERVLVRLAAVADAVAPDREVMLDLYVWRAGGLGEPDATAAELHALLQALPRRRALRRVVFVIAGPAAGGDTRVQYFTFRPAAEGYAEEAEVRGLHPMMAKRLHLWRLRNFALERLPAAPDVYLFRAVAHANPKDVRLFALAEVRDVTPVRDATGRVTQLPDLERMLREAAAAMRDAQAHLEERLHWNRILLYVWPPLTVGREELVDLAHGLGPITEDLGLEQVVVRARVPGASGTLTDTVVRISGDGLQGLRLVFDRPPTLPLRPLGAYEQKVLSLRRRGLVYPYELVAMLAPPADAQPTGLPPGTFVEHDLDAEGRLVPVTRAPGENAANVVVGLIRNVTVQVPEGMERVILLGDPSREMGSLAEPECRRIAAALALARERRVPVEWFALSAGAKISMESGTENMDWISRVLRHIIEFTQAGGEINVVVCGINVGAQPYWNAEATMLMHTRGILVMTPESTMVLTGKQALDYSGSVSAEDNLGIGGYERIMGPNGQAQYFAGDLSEACAILLRHYAYTYVVPGETFPRPAASPDPVDRDVCVEPYGGAGGFATIGDVLSGARNPGRKTPFEVRRVMAAVVDRDAAPLERWPHMRDADIAVVWDARIGGVPVCLIGIESHPVRRLGFVPADGPEQWTAGTLFPQSSKKVARAVNATSGTRPLVVLANLSGFDGSPESMRKLQLEYGAEIGRAVVNFRGPIVFCVISRYHGGAFVVFSRALNAHLEAAALEGTYASVIGGAPAAAVVFAREVERRTRGDARVVAAEGALAAAAPDVRAALRADLDAVRARVRSEKLGMVAEEFDHVHSVERARRMGSLDHIIPASRLRPYLVEALARGMRRWEDAVRARSG